MKPFVLFTAFFVAFFLVACASGHKPGTSFTANSLTPQAEQARIHVELAAAYYKRKKLGVALEELKTAQKIEAGYAPAYGLQALIYLALRLWDDAEKAFQHALRLDATDLTINHNYAWFLCHQRQRYRASLAYFAKVINSQQIKHQATGWQQQSLAQGTQCARHAGDDPEQADYWLRIGK